MAVIESKKRNSNWTKHTFLDFLSMVLSFF